MQMTAAPIQTPQAGRPRRRPIGPSGPIQTDGAEQCYRRCRTQYPMKVGRIFAENAGQQQPDQTHDEDAVGRIPESARTPGRSPSHKGTACHQLRAASPGRLRRGSRSPVAPTGRNMAAEANVFWTGLPCPASPASLLVVTIWEGRSHSNSWFWAKNQNNGATRSRATIAVSTGPARRAGKEFAVCCVWRGWPGVLRLVPEPEVEGQGDHQKGDDPGCLVGVHG